MGGQSDDDNGNRTPEKPFLENRQRLNGDGSNTSDATSHWYNDVLKAAWSGVHPGLSAASVRASALGLQGKLNYDVNQVAKTMGEIDSPMGKQLIDRFQRMQTAGWRFEPRSPLESLAHGASADINQVVRVLRYEKPSVIPYAFGMAQNPVRGAAVLMAHELGHMDGVLTFDPYHTFGNLAEQKVLGLRTLATETNATLVELHVADHLGVSKYSDWRHAAFRNGTLGAELWDVYREGKSTLNLVAREEANTFVRDWIVETLGPDAIDAKTGRIRAFDLERANQSYVGKSLRYDATFAQELVSADTYLFRRANAPAHAHPRLSLATLSETRLGGAFMNGTKLIGALGMVAGTTDILGQFQHSYGAGFGRTAKVGIGFGGFEAGSMVARFTLNRFPGYAPLKLLLGGFAGAYIAERTLGNAAEQLVKDQVKSWLGERRLA